MTDTVIIFFGASVAVCFFAIVTFFVVVSYHKALKKQKELQETVDKLTLEGSGEANKILLQARNDALAILKDAQLRGQKVIEASDVFSNQFKDDFRKHLFSFVEDEKKVYESIANEMQSEGNKVLSSLSNNINQQIDSEIKAFHSAIQNEAVRTQKAIANNAQEDYKLVRNEIQAYKKMMLDRIDQAAVEMVKDIAKQVLGASLTKEEHQKLVLEALKEAKESHVL